MKTRDKVLEDRYLQEGETENDMYQRVAQHLATTNQEAVEFYDVMSNMLFLPNTPTLVNAGSDRAGGYSACFVPNQHILTPSGFKQICDINKGDCVITHTGNIRKVIQVSSRYINEDIYHIDVVGLPKHTLCVTGEHPILSITEDNMHCIRYKGFKCTRNKKHCHATKNQYKDDCIKKDIILQSWEKVKNLNPGEYVAINVDRTEVSVDYDNDDNDIAFMFGFWIAEGSMELRSVTFCNNNVDILDRIERTMSQLTNHKPTKWIHKCGTYYIKYNDTHLAKQFVDWFGYNKTLPTWILQAPISWQQEFMAGILAGDGYITPHGIGLVMSRRHLISQLWSIGMRVNKYWNWREFLQPLGTDPRYGGIHLNISNTKSKQYIQDGGLLFARIRSVTKVPYNGLVYNMEVEEDNSYIAKGVCVHNCYVLPIDDNIDSIYKTLKDHALIHKAFGGTGLNFSKIRPEGDMIKSTGGRATGPIGFIKLFDANASAIKQGGHREGANMAILNVSHPDIEKFIDAEFDHFNSSVGVTDTFMEVVRDNKSWRLHFDGKSYCNISARALFQKICNAAWKSGNPGIVFLDRIQEFNPTPDEVMDATNPCGEQVLLPYESCNLGSINLAKMVTINQDNPEVDWQLLDHTISIAVDLLDAVISLNEYPLEEVREKTLATRKIGLGVMGWHDMLIHMGIAYDSSEALELADEVMECITNIGVAHSIDRGVDIGVFPNWENSIWNDKQVRMRNATVTTIAPTGTLSIIAECSSGIEPVYDWEYVRKVESGTFVERHPTADLAEAHGLTDTAKDISWKAHIRMQAAFQKHVHNAVSKTINMKNDVTVEDVKWAYEMAYETGCKGVTVYRDGSRDEQVLSSIDDMKHNPPLLSTDGSVTSGQMVFNDTNQPLGFISSEQKTDNERPKTVSGKTTKCTSGCGSLFVTTNVVDGKPYELFVHHSDGGCQSNMEAIGRLISLALKEGIEVDEIVGQLSKIKCSNAIRSSKSEGDSCSQIIGKQLLESMEDKNSKYSGHISAIAGTELKRGQIVGFIDDTIVSVIPDVPTIDDNEFVNYSNKCPECGDKLDFGEGCNQGMCRSCGWSGCN